MEGVHESLKNAVSLYEPDIDASVWTRFAHLWHETTQSCGSYLVQHGEHNDRVFFIIKGVLRAYSLGEDGQERNRTFFMENMFVSSLASVLLKHHSNLGIQALTDVVALEASIKAVQEMAASEIAIARLYIHHLEEEWVVKREQQEMRLAALHADDRYDLFLREYPDLERRIPLYHIASHLGITNGQLSMIRARRRL